MLTPWRAPLSDCPFRRHGDTHFFARRSLALAILAVSLWPFAWANATNLASNSPFSPADEGLAGSRGHTVSSLEFVGVLRVGNTWTFSIRHSVKRRGTWVKLHEPGYDFMATEYYPDQESIDVIYERCVVKLTLVKSHDLSATANVFITASESASPSSVLIGQLTPEQVEASIMSHATISQPE
jgi:hypothetical protein